MFAKFIHWYDGRWLYCVMEVSLKSLFVRCVLIIIIIILFLHSHSLLRALSPSHYFFLAYSRPLHYFISNYAQRKKARKHNSTMETKGIRFFLAFLLSVVCICYSTNADKLLSSVLFSLCMVLCCDFIFFCIYTSVYRNHSPIFVAVVLLMIFIAYLLVFSL